MVNFTEVKPLRYWVQHILPLVYDDSLSYMELLGKVVNTLNEVVKNNNLLPDYIAENIKEYISSGEIEKVLAEVLANYMLNVKFPPAGLTPATGDGSTDDTEAIQGCIDYAYNHGGMSVYFPSGSYLTQPLTLRDKATLFGQDRYTTRLVMKGGSTKAMFTGDVDELTLTGLGFDGNMDIQVNNVNLFTISVNSAIITNCLLTDGYDLLNITVNNDLQLNNIIFKHAVENALVLNGDGFVQGDNLIFKTISALIGKNFVVMNVSNSILEQLKCHGASPNAVLINGNNNVVKMWNDHSTKAYTDNGTNNTILVYTQSEQKKLTGFKTTNVSGNLSETVGGDKTETVTGDKTETITGNKTEAITGDKDVNANNLTEAMTGSCTRTVTGDINENAKNLKAVIQLTYDLTANTLTEHLTEKEVNATNSTEKLGNKTETITGDKTVNANNSTENITTDKHITAGSVTENITGDKQVSAANSTETIQGNKTVTAGDISEKTGNKTVHATKNSTEQTDGKRTLIVTGANIETTGAKTETINGNATETYNGDRFITENNVEENAKNYEINTAQMRVKTTKPLSYNHTPSKYNDYFNFIPMIDFEGNDYKVLVANEKTNDIGNRTFVNVKDFGAVGDALYFNKANNTYWTDINFTIPPTNDVAAFERAIEYALANNIGTIFIPNGSYYLPNKTFTLDTSKLRMVGEDTTKLVSAGLSDGCFIGLISPLVLGMYSFARAPLENICIAGSYFTDEENVGVIGISYGVGSDKPTTFISPHMSIINVTIEYFAVGIELATAYKSVAYNLNIIACNIGIFIPATVNAIVPWNVYGIHVECCNFGIYSIAPGYSSLNFFGGAFEYNRGVYTGTSKVTFVCVRFESDLTASCTPDLKPRTMFIVSGDGAPYARFVNCNFLFIPDYVSNVSYWVANPYKLNAWGDDSVIAGSSQNFYGAYDYEFKSCEFATDQFTTKSKYFVSSHKVYAEGCSLLGSLNKNYFFNPAQLVISDKGIIG